MRYPQVTNPRCTPRRQRGAALIVSLILLLVMTVVGVSAMRSSVMEVRMAGSVQQQEDALRDAERTLAMAEDQIDTWVSDGSFTAEGGGFFRTGSPDVRTPDWSGIETASGATAGDSARSARNRFVVLYAGARTVPGESLSQGRGERLAGREIYLFRPVARSSQSDRAVRLVESLYATTIAP